MQFPHWLEILSIVSLVAAGASAFIIVADLVAGHPQHMWIMNLVWPITGLYFGPLALWMYFRWGRLTTKQRVKQAKQSGEENPGKHKPFWEICCIGTLHCGSGCTLGDVIAEWTMFLFPLVLFGKKIFATWVLDYILAFLFGIAFQYFSIKPMKNLSPGKGLAAALKADSLSLTAWQIGMYGWMAIATFLIFRRELEKTSPVFWFMMQVAMWLGFLTSYPMNWWLIRKGIKEKM